MTDKEDVQKDDVFYAILVKPSCGTLGLVVSRDNSIISYRSEKEALDSFSYQEGHSRGYEASMSACMHWMSFQPKVVRIEGIEDAEERLIGIPPFSINSLSSIAGNMLAMECSAGTAMDVYENAIDVPLAQQP